MVDCKKENRPVYEYGFSPFTMTTIACEPDGTASESAANCHHAGWPAQRRKRASSPRPAQLDLGPALDEQALGRHHIDAAIGQLGMQGLARCRLGYRAHHLALHVGEQGIAP